MTRFAFAAIAALTLGTAAMAEPVKIGIAAEAYPPFASPDAAGNWVGWEVEIINAVCAASAMDCVITPVAWDGIIPSLTSGQIDAIMASMSITDERRANAQAAVVIAVFKFVASVRVKSVTRSAARSQRDLSAALVNR